MKNKSGGWFTSTEAKWLALKQKRFSRRTTGVVLAAFLVATGSGIAHAQTASFEVFLEGQSIGYVQDAAMATEVVDNLNKEAQKQTGKENAYRVDSDEIVIKPTSTLANKMDLTECAAKIQTTCPEVLLAGATITINDQTIAVESQKVADQVLEDYKKECADTAGVSVADCNFKENVSVTPVAVDTGSSKNYNQTMDYFKEGAMSVTQDTVKAGEGNNGVLVAANRGISLDHLAAMNQDKDVNALNEGDVINTVVKAPALTVTATVQKKYAESIPFETEEQPDNSLEAGKESIQQEGQAGSKDVEAVITYENGREVSKNVLSETITQEPVKCIKKVGAAAAKSAGSHPAITGSGQFWMPAAGSIGEIYRDGDSGSNHTGGCAVDILNSEGTPIYASASGTVTRAGWYGGYGNCVEIDHGNGYSTLYGHMSAIGVSAGQTVSQGECIGEMGSTGSSTANHVHFEVKYNGVAQPVTDFLPL